MEIHFPQSFIPLNTIKRIDDLLYYLKQRDGGFDKSIVAEVERYIYKRGFVIHFKNKLLELGYDYKKKMNIDIDSNNIKDSFDYDNDKAKPLSETYNTKGISQIRIIDNTKTGTRQTKDLLDEEKYYSFFENNSIGLHKAISTLIAQESVVAIFVIIQLLGNTNIQKRLNWRKPSVKDLEQFRLYASCYKLFGLIYPLLSSVIKSNTLPIKGINNQDVSLLSLEDFTAAFEKHMLRTNEKKRKPKKRKKPRNSNSTNDYKSYLLKRRNKDNKEDTKSLYNDYEYGLSDW